MTGAPLHPHRLRHRLAVYVLAVVLAWRKVSASNNEDVNGLFVATVCGFAGLLLLTLWLQDREG